MKNLFKSSLFAAVIVLMLMLFPVSQAQAATNVLAQYFGNASATTFTVPSVTSGYTVGVTLDGVPTSYTWSSSGVISLASAPAARVIVQITETNVAESRSEVATSKFMFPATYNANGVVITTMLTTSGAIDFASTATLTSPTDGSFTVTGAAVNDVCTVGLPAAPTAGMVYTCFVSAADTVKVREFNASAGTVDAASATFRVYVQHVLNQLGL